jgi:hydroxyacylglutathione hydrolase
MKVLKAKKPLKLKNKGKVEIFFIGCGTAFGKVLYNNNFIIVKGDTHLMVDFGITGPIALREKSGLDISKIENLLITHSHTDHIGGLEYLALYNRYISQPLYNKPKLKMIISEEYEKILWNMSLRGGMEWNETSSKGKKLEFSDYFIAVQPKLVTNIPRKTLKINFDGIGIELFSTNHIPDNAESHKEAFLTFGLFVDNRILISGDTKFDRSMFDLYSDRAEIIFHDVSFDPNPVHASLEQLKTLPKEIKDKIYLMHYGDNWRKQDISDFAGLVKQGYRYIF